jgi:hypothetical protein
LKQFDLYIETERLIIRPFQKEDYMNWYKQYDSRLPSQYKYDYGRPIDMPLSTEYSIHNQFLEKRLCD